MKSKISLLAAAFVCAGAVQLAAQNVSVPTASVPLPTSKLVVSRDSFLIVVQGQPMGSTVFAVELTATGAHITENLTMGAMGGQTTDILADAQGRPSKLVQNGKFAGQDVNIDVDYANNRAKGKVVAPGKAPFDLDADFPATAIDENVLQAILPTLPWAAGAKWEANMFSPGNNTVTKNTLTVTGTEKVTVPAGMFDAYRAELSDGTRTVAFYITTDAAHRLIRIAPIGAPFEMQLAKRL